jgi:hypothetical protein
MVVKEFYRTRKDGVNLYKTYSDANFYIQKVNTDEIYRCAIDVEGAAFEYVETDKIIEEKSEKRKAIKNNRE